MLHGENSGTGQTHMGGIDPRKSYYWTAARPIKNRESLVDMVRDFML